LNKTLLSITYSSIDGSFPHALETYFYDVSGQFDDNVGYDLIIDGILVRHPEHLTNDDFLFIKGNSMESEEINEENYIRLNNVKLNKAFYRTIEKTSLPENTFKFSIFRRLSNGSWGIPDDIGDFMLQINLTMVAFNE
jgi:hypothetical protein